MSSDRSSEVEVIEVHFITKLLHNAPFVVSSVYCTWLLVGTIWYKFYMSWTFSTAFYYAVEAGLSIGFCYPSEKDDITRSFTIIFVLLGSSVISGSLGFLASYLLGNQSYLEPVEYHLDSMSWRDEENKVTVTSLGRYLWYVVKYSLGWYSNRVLLKTMAVFWVWMGLGVVYGMLVEKWDFITSLYWAITSTSTGGLQTAPCLPGSFGNSGTECDMGNFRGTIMGAYFVIGVPSKLFYFNVTILTTTNN